MDALDRRSLLLGAAALLGTPAVRASDGTADAAASRARPAVPRPVWCYDADVALEADIPHGKTPYGERVRVPIVGGTFKGPEIAGKILSGGADWQLVRSDGYLELHADYFMQTHDGVPIHVVNHGLWHSATGDWPADYAITTPTFEVAAGRYEWLNRHVFVGTVAPGTPGKPAVLISVYKLV